MVSDSLGGMVRVEGGDRAVGFVDEAMKSRFESDDQGVRSRQYNPVYVYLPTIPESSHCDAQVRWIKMAI